MILSLGEDGRISLKQSEEDLSGITIAEWGAANMKLMNYLMSTGDLSRDKVEFYCAYTMQIFEMSDVYECSSIRVTTTDRFTKKLSMVVTSSLKKNHTLFLHWVLF